MNKHIQNCFLLGIVCVVFSLIYTFLMHSVDKRLKGKCMCYCLLAGCCGQALQTLLLYNLKL